MSHEEIDMAVDNHAVCYRYCSPAKDRRTEDDTGYYNTRITNNGFNFPGIRNTDIDGRLLRYDATIVVKNNGSRRVKAFTLGIVFVDLETKTEVENRKVYLRKSIAPMAEKTLSRGVLQTNKPGTIIVKAVIDRVEYDDGSVWQNP